MQIGIQGHLLLRATKENWWRTIHSPIGRHHHKPSKQQRQTKQNPKTQNTKAKPKTDTRWLATSSLVDSCRWWQHCHPRVIRGRQIQVNGRPYPSPAGTWCNRQPKNLVHMQGKLWHPLLRWPAPMARPPSGVLGRIGRLVGDQERNKSSYSHTKFDINPRERRQTKQVPTGYGHRRNYSPRPHHAMVHTKRLHARPFPPGDRWRPAIWYRSRIAVISLLKQQALSCGLGLTADARRHSLGGTQCQKISPAPVAKTKRQELLYAIQPRSNDQAPRQLL